MEVLWLKSQGVPLSRINDLPRIRRGANFEVFLKQPYSHVLFSENFVIYCIYFVNLKNIRAKVNKKYETTFRKLAG